jgi:hypothetical protein
MKLSTAGLFVSVLGIAAVARAQETIDTREPESSAPIAVGDGSFLPQTLSARVGSVQAYGYGSGGYDSSRGRPLIDSAVEARVWGPFALRFQATYSGDTERMRPSLGGRLQLLRQEKHGVDAALTVFFKTEGFTETEGEIETFASLGRRFRLVTVIGDLAYGQDPEGNERDAEVHAAAFHQHGRFMYGVDSRVRFALGAQRGRAATTEPVFDFLGGPVAMATTELGAIFAQVGPSAFELDHSAVRVGVAALAGFGAVY